VPSKRFSMRDTSEGGSSERKKNIYSARGSDGLEGQSGNGKMVNGAKVHVLLQARRKGGD